MLKVKNSVRLPLKDFIGKGSYQERIEHAKKLNAQFYEAIQSKMFEGMISVDEFKRTLQENLPENIKFNFKTYIKKFLGHDNAYVSILTNNYDEVDRYEIQIPSRKYFEGQKVVENRDNNFSFHETFHMFFEMANPKHIARCNFNETEYKFYQGWIYTNMHSQFNLKDRMKWKNRVKEFLAQRSLEKQIDFLQNCRYRLLEEKLAYQEGEKYGNSDYMSKFFFFDEKLKIVEKLLYKAIKKARKENKKA